VNLCTRRRPPAAQPNPAMPQVLTGTAGYRRQSGLRSAVAVAHIDASPGRGHSTSADHVLLTGTRSSSRLPTRRSFCTPYVLVLQGHCQF
jgi:hypothetical protein